MLLLILAYFPMRHAHMSAEPNLGRMLKKTDISEAEDNPTPGVVAVSIMPHS
jgi:hypothetical protein